MNANELREPQIGDVIRPADDCVWIYGCETTTLDDAKDVAFAKGLIRSGRWVLVEAKEKGGDA